MLWYEALILGIVEGITEFLPVSSTGHLIIAAALLGLTGDDGAKKAVDAFTIVIQGCSLIAVVGLYRARVMQMVRGVVGRDLAGRRLLIHLLLAFAPIFILGPLLHSTIKAHLFAPGPVLAALLLGGVWMIWLDRSRTTRTAREGGIEIDEMTWKHALGIGLLQCASMWPGTSRAMMTIAGGIVLGLKPARSAEFSFLLGLPTIAGATVYELYSNVRDARASGEANMFEQLGAVPIVIGMVVTVIVAWLVMKWLVAFLSQRGLALFGWYRIAFCVVMAGLLWSGVIALQS